MTYRPRTFDSIDAVPIADWMHVCENSPARDLMLPAFIRAVEAGSRAFARFTHVVIYDDGGEPMACACFTLLTLEIEHVVSPGMSALIRALPRPLSGLFRAPLVMCGLPISLGQSSIAFAPRCDVDRVVLLLEEMASRLSQEESAQLILFKEFDAETARVMNALQAHGYVRLQTPPMNVFDPVFESFGAYCQALKSNYRVGVRRSLRKLARGDAHVRVISDPSEMLAKYTPDLHRLYLDVVAKSTLKLEVLPIDFFLELVRQFPASVELILIEDRSRVVGTAWTLQVGRVYYCLFLGLDYRRNSELDLYYNIIFAALDSALKKRPARIECGQTADTFKSRLGCRRENRFVFARGTRWHTRLLSRYGQQLLALEPPPRQFSIYRDDANKQGSERDETCSMSS